MKLNEWIDIWLEVYKLPFLKDNSKEALTYYIQHIRQTFGDVEMSEIKGYTVQDFINSLSVTPNMQHKVVVYLRDIFDYAVRNDYLDKSPMRAVKFRAKKVQRFRALTLSELEVLNSYIQNKSYRILLLAYLYSGARRNEVIAPGAFAVDFEKNIITISGTKTENSARQIPLSPLLKVELEKLDDYSAYLTSYSSNHVTRLVRRVTRKLGIEGICVHSLRKTFATLCFLMM